MVSTLVIVCIVGLWLALAVLCTIIPYWINQEDEIKLDFALLCLLAAPIMILPMSVAVLCVKAPVIYRRKK